MLRLCRFAHNEAAVFFFSSGCICTIFYTRNSKSKKELLSQVGVIGLEEQQHWCISTMLRWTDTDCNIKSQKSSLWNSKSFTFSLWNRNLVGDIMEFEQFGIEGDDDDDSAAVQYMIEQSLLESNKQKEGRKEDSTRGGRRSETKLNTLFSHSAETFLYILHLLCINNDDWIKTSDSIPRPRDGLKKKRQMVYFLLWPIFLYPCSHYHSDSSRWSSRSLSLCLGWFV